MSKSNPMFAAVNIRVSPDGIGQVFLNGTDISNRCVSCDIHIKGGSLPEVTLTMLPDAMSASLERADVKQLEGNHEED